MQSATAGQTYGYHELDNCSGACFDYGASIYRAFFTLSSPHCLLGLIVSYLQLENVFIRFPVYNARGRSLKSTLVRTTTGGRVAADHGCLVVEALKGVDLKIEGGDRVALLGHNGSGKSSLLRVMAGIYEPSSGRIKSEGRVTAMFDPNLGISLEATGWDNVETRGILLGLNGDQIEQLKDDVAELSGLGDFLEMPVRTYSAGMRMRLAFFVSTSISPDILLLDESILAGDANFIQMARKRVNQLIADANILVLASHSQEILKSLCNRGILMNHGEATFYPDVEEMLDIYNQQVKNQQASRVQA